VLDRLSANTLLKSVIGALASIVIVMLAAQAWNAWRRLAEVGRIVTVTETSGYAFKAMNNMRADRGVTMRLLTVPEAIDPAILDYTRKIRDDELPAFRAAVGLLGGIDFADKSTLYPELQRLLASLTKLQSDSWADFTSAKPTRQDDMAKQYDKEGTALLDALDRLAARLFAAVRHGDAVVDHMLEMKQLAWFVRNQTGEASFLIVNGLATGKMPPDARARYLALVGGSMTAWAALEDMAFGADLPPALTEALAIVKRSWLDPAYIATRDRMLDALIDGTKPEMTGNQWSPLTVGRMTTLVGVAEAALDAAKTHAESQRDDAERGLAVDLVLLAAALARSATPCSAAICRSRRRSPAGMTRSARSPAHSARSVKTPSRRRASRPSSAPFTTRRRRASRPSIRRSRPSRSRSARRSKRSAAPPATCARPPRP
jgi:hypothetical protein